MTLARKVAICAVSQTPFTPRNWSQRFQEMGFACVEAIVEATGVGFDEARGIRTVVTCSDDVFDARTISDNAMTDAVGAHYRCEEKVAMDGVNAVGYALAEILSGHDDLVLVVGHGKESQPVSREACTNLAFDPFYGRPLGLDYLSAAALQARAYMERSEVTEEELAAAVVHSRRQASLNPRARARDAVSREQVLASPLVCDPLRELHVSPVTDGAVALLLAAEERVAELTDRPVWIRGFGNCMDSYYLGERELSGSVALRRACERAYTMAGIQEPARELDVVEVSDPYAHQLLLAMEELRIAPPGGGGRFAASGELAARGVNLSGGSLAGSPMIIAGLARTAEAVRQLRGEAGDVQRRGARRGLAHGCTGPAGQHQSVLILEGAAA